jgi:hypothetical protein
VTRNANASVLTAPGLISLPFLQIFKVGWLAWAIVYEYVCCATTFAFFPTHQPHNSSLWTLSGHFFAIDIFHTDYSVYVPLPH